MVRWVGPGPTTSPRQAASRGTSMPAIAMPAARRTAPTRSANYAPCWRRCERIPVAEDLVIETDSQYAINCSTKWVQGWKRNGWKNSQKKPVKNADLIRAIDNEIAHRAGSVRFVWVKGHAGNAGNEKVDELARTYAGDCRCACARRLSAVGRMAVATRFRVFAWHRCSRGCRGC